MKNNRGINFIVIISVTIIVAIIGLTLFTKPSVPENKEPKDNSMEIKTSIIFDTDPNECIKLDVNAVGKIVNVENLNDESKEIIDGLIINRNLDDVFNQIIDKFEAKEFIKNKKIDVVLQSTGEMSEVDVLNIIKGVLEVRDITPNVIVPIITEDARTFAKDSKISDAKAAFILDVTIEHPELHKEDLINKSISEIIALANAKTK